jgi:hypothetical protein
MFSQNTGSFSRSMRYRAIPACLLSLALLSPQRILAWGNSGHEAVAYVAWQQMSPAARTRAIALIKRVPTLQNPEKTRSIPGYAEWVMDLPAGLSADQKNLYLFMRAATWPDSIKHQWLHDSDTPPAAARTRTSISALRTPPVMDIGTSSTRALLRMDRLSLRLRYRMRRPKLSLCAKRSDRTKAMTSNPTT